MKRSLIPQMLHDWRSNIWMVVELTIVFIVLWVLFTTICGFVNVRLKRTGYDVTDLYFGEIRFVSEDASAYVPYDSLHSQSTDVEMLIANLRANPHVETVGPGTSVVTYQYNYYGVRLSADSIEYFGNMRMVTPDVIRAYRLESLDGHTTEQLADIIARGHIIISEPERTFEGRADADQFIGKDVFVNGDSSRVVPVEAKAYGLRRSDYEPQNGVIYMPMDPTRIPGELVIRVRPGQGRQFLESLTANDKRIGNAYLSQLLSVDEAREIAHLDTNITIRNFLLCAIFLMIVIFLGFLGTFWFRTQQRVGEIAVRIVNGASRADIFRRFLGEGMLLLCMAIILAIPVGAVILHYGIIDDFFVTYGTEIGFASPEVYQSLLLTAVSLLLLILAGVFFPARKAMNINPAFALKDQ